MENVNPNVPELSKPKTKKYVSYLPKKEVDILSVSKLVDLKWTEKTTAVDIRWTNLVEFQDAYKKFEMLIQFKNLTGAQRKELTRQVKQKNKELDYYIGIVHGRISEKFGMEKAAIIYPQFGYEGKSQNSYPTKTKDRLFALDMMVKSVEKFEMSDMPYGLDFWKDFKANYALLLGQTGVTDSSDSDKTSEKNEIKKYLQKTHKSLIKYLESTQPDTYKSEIRAWGFHREKY